MNTNNKLFLIVILLLATVLRLYQLGEYPIHLTNDEAALGYNAYSILETGRDEHGQFMPIIFKSFGDWKPGLYVYATVPFVFLFGLTEVAVRLPSAIAGIISVILVYLIAKKLISERIGLLAALSLAIMPWHIHFSRGAWEANIALFLLLAAIIFFLKSLEKGSYIVLSAIFFGISLWAYQSAKLASLLPLLVLVTIYKDKVLAVNKKYLVSSIVFGFVLSIPIIFSLFTGKSGRIEVMSVFSYTRPEEYIKETVYDHEAISKNGLIFTMYHSESFNLARGVIGRYFNYFSGRFLFFEGDWSNPKHTAPDSGYLLYASIPILTIGALSLLKESGKKSYFVILLWFLLAPIPAALTRDSAHGVRALNLVIPLAFILGMGFNTIYVFIKRNRLLLYGIAILLAGGFIYSLFLYTDAYYVQNPVKNADKYLYGYKQAVNKIERVKNKYNLIVFDQSFDQPYIYFLFYTKYPPGVYQKHSSFVDNASGDVGFVTHLDNIEFRPTRWSADKLLQDTLLVGKVTAFPPHEVTNTASYNVDVVNYPDKSPAFYFIDPI